MKKNSNNNNHQRSKAGIFENWISSHPFGLSAHWATNEFILHAPMDALYNNIIHNAQTNKSHNCFERTRQSNDNIKTVNKTAKDGTDGGGAVGDRGGTCFFLLSSLCKRARARFACKWICILELNEWPSNALNWNAFFRVCVFFFSFALSFVSLIWQ